MVKIPMGQIVLVDPQKKDMMKHDEDLYIYNYIYICFPWIIFHDEWKKQYICRKVNASSSLDFFKLHQNAQTNPGPVET